MKLNLALSILALTGGSAKAQLFSDNQLGGALLGGIIGGVAGHNNNRQTAEGIGIGAGVGYLLGSLNDRSDGYSRGRTSFSVGYGTGYSGYRHRYGRGFGHFPRHHSRYGHGHYRPSFGVSYTSYPTYRYATPVYTSPAYTTSAYTTPVYATQTRERPNYALSGAAAGGLLGAVIGHNSNRQTAEGAAIGAGAGLLLGGLAEHQSRRREAEAQAQAAARARVLSSQRPAQQQVYTQPRQTSLYAPAVVTGKTPVAETSTDSSTSSSYRPIAPANYSSLSGANRLFGR